MTEIPANERGAWRIALIAASILLLELALIRQMPAEIRALSYFTNLILMAAFFGLGLGCILQRRRSLAALLPIGLSLIAGLLWLGRGVVVYSEAADVHYWLGRGAEAGSRALQLPLAPAAIAAFVVSGLAFVALGQRLAREMDRRPRLVAYGWDIGGSLGGTLTFVVASWLELPPWIWPPIVMTVWAVVFVRGAAARLVHVAIGLLFVGFAVSPHESRWSPYYLVQHATEPDGIRVWVNSGFHQFCLDFTAERLDETATDSAGGAARGETTRDPNESLQRFMRRKWSLPYDMYRHYHDDGSPRRVLVLGAGTGNDVNIALLNGAQEVVAVEIDPVILDLGRRLNPTRPYDDPRVRTIIDDGRHALRTLEQPFDLIVFGTLDSQTLLSGRANLRMENYVYTRESLADARDLLADGGLLAVHYSVFRPWLYGRLLATVRETFGDRSRMFGMNDPFLFNTTIVASRDLPIVPDPKQIELFRDARPSTDDWPFVYLERPTISGVYLELFAVVGVLIIGAMVLLRRVHRASGFHAEFFLLGLGFTLMESSAIVRLALLFGNTWTVNAVVFSSVLATMFLANLAVLRGLAPRLAVAWPALWIAVAINLALPLRWLLHAPAAARVLLAAALIGLPVFFAATCFSRLFRRQPVTGYPLGVNLIGAMAGGVVEYVSMVTGMRAVWGLVLAVYVAAWLASRYGRPTPPPGPAIARPRGYNPAS